MRTAQGDFVLSGAQMRQCGGKGRATFQQLHILQREVCTIQQRRVLFFTNAADHLANAFTLALQHDGHAIFDDAALFRRDFFDRIAEHAGVIQTDARDGANRRLQYIGGIQPSAKPDLDHSPIHILLRKPGEHQRRADFKHRRKAFPGFFHLHHLFCNPRRQARQNIICNGLAINAHPLIVAHEVGRCIQADFCAGLPQHAVNQRTGRPLAVCPRHMDAPQLFLRIAQAAHQAPHVLQSNLNALARLAVDKGNRFLVIHAVSCLRKGTFYLLVYPIPTPSVNCKKGWSCRFLPTIQTKKADALIRLFIKSEKIRDSSCPPDAYAAPRAWSCW